MPDRVTTYTPLAEDVAADHGITHSYATAAHNRNADEKKDDPKFHIAIDLKHPRPPKSILAKESKVSKSVQIKKPQKASVGMYVVQMYLELVKYHSTAAPTPLSCKLLCSSFGKTFGSPVGLVVYTVLTLMMAGLGVPALNDYLKRHVPRGWVPVQETGMHDIQTNTVKGPGKDFFYDWGVQSRCDFEMLRQLELMVVCPTFILAGAVVVALVHLVTKRCPCCIQFWAVFAFLLLLVIFAAFLYLLWAVGIWIDYSFRYAYTLHHRSAHDPDLPCEAGLYASWEEVGGLACALLVFGIVHNLVNCVRAQLARSKSEKAKVAPSAAAVPEMQ